MFYRARNPIAGRIWDNWLFFHEGRWGFWSATPKGRDGFGFGYSEDGLRWKALEPPRMEGRAFAGEVGACEKIGDRYYLLNKRANEVFVWISDRPEGPYFPAEKNFTFLTRPPYSHNRVSRLENPG